MSNLPAVTAAGDRSRIGVVLPARNEAAVIARCLASIAAQRCDAHISVIVAVNGTNDSTAEIARRMMKKISRDRAERPLSIEVIELHHASKTSALNTAEAKLGSSVDMFVYIDADVRLSKNAFQRMLTALSTEKPLLVQPRRCAEPDAPIASRVFSRALCSLPWVESDVVCGGIYATNAVGRTLWSAFPRVAAEDAYVFTRFDSTQRIVLQECWATHPAPAGVWGLLRQQRRWRTAAVELRNAGLQGPHGSSWSTARRIRRLLSDPRVLAAVCIVSAVRLAMHLAATGLESDSWHPDRARSVQ
jgi:hypothetical protein